MSLLRWYLRNALWGPLRWATYRLMWHRQSRGYYAAGPQAGYAGWVEIGNRLVAFEREDGTLQFTW